MNLNNLFKLLGIGIIALAAGYSVGYFYAPGKVRTVEKIVEREKKVTEENRKVTERFDKETGKVVERIEETGKKQSEVNTKRTDKESEKTKSQPMWAVKGGVAVNPRDVQGKPIPRVGGEVALPLFNSSLGLEVDLNINRPLTGVYLRVAF